MRSNITHLHFFRSNSIYFGHKEPIKVQIFDTFKCLGQNSSNYSIRFWNNKSIPLQIFYHSSSSVHKSSVHKLLAHAFFTLDQRISSRSQFWDFQVLWWKFNNFLVSFSKAKVIFSSNFASVFRVMKDNSCVLF